MKIFLYISIISLCCTSLYGQLIKDLSTKDKADLYQGIVYSKRGDCQKANQLLNGFIREFKGNDRDYWIAKAKEYILPCSDVKSTNNLEYVHRPSIGSPSSPSGPQILEEESHVFDLDIFLDMNRFVIDDIKSLTPESFYPIIDHLDIESTDSIVDHFEEESHDFDLDIFLDMNRFVVDDIKSLSPESFYPIIEKNNTIETAPNISSIDVKSLNSSYILCQGTAHENIWESRMRTAANSEQPSGDAHENIWESRMRTAPNETNPNAKGVAHENIWESKMITAPSGQDVTYHICNGVAHENIWESKMIAPSGSSITAIDKSNDDLPTGTKHENVWESKMIIAPSGDSEVHVVVCNGIAHENIWESKMKIAGGVPSDIIKIRGVKHENVWENKEMRTASGQIDNSPTGTKHENVWESKMIAGPNGAPEIVNIICDHESHFHDEEESITDLVKNSKNIYITCNGVAHENIWESRMRTASANDGNQKGVSHENIWESKMRTAGSTPDELPTGTKHENVWESKMITAPSGQDVNYHICNGVAHENIWESRMRTAPGSSITDMDESDDDLPTGTKHENVWESKMIIAPTGDSEIHVVICNGVAHENIWESKMRIAGGVSSDIIKIRGVKHENVWENKEMRTASEQHDNSPTGTKHENVWESKMITGPNGSTEILHIICDHEYNLPVKENAITTGSPIREKSQARTSIDYATRSKQHHYKILFSIESNPNREYLSLSNIGPVTSKEATPGNYMYYVGFYEEKDEADAALKRVKAAGHPIARIMEFNKGELTKEHIEEDQIQAEEKIVESTKPKIISEPLVVESKEEDEPKPQIDEVVKSEVISYHILFRVLDNPYETFDDLKTIGPLYRETFDSKGNSRYLIGNTASIDEAKSMLDKVKESGYKASFIAEYKNGSLHKILQQ